MKFIAKTLFSLLVVIVTISYWVDFNVLSYITSPLSNTNTTYKDEATIIEEEAGVASSQKGGLCYVNLQDKRPQFEPQFDHTDLKMIYYVTPTYPRPEQLPELTRLSHTLMHIPHLHWIVADDQTLCSADVQGVLKRSGLPFTHLTSPKPKKFKGNFPRGVSNRRAALDWLRVNAHEGVLYFGDDDNTVDLRLFDEIRKTNKVSMFPVGLIGEYGVSSPVVINGKVVGFYDSWPASRTFPVDMAGFAVSVAHLRQRPAAAMPYIAGYEEDRFLRSLGLRIDEIQPLADDCSKVLVWHTRTLKYKKPNIKANLEKLSRTKYARFAALLNETFKTGLASVDSDIGAETFLSRNRKIYISLSNLASDPKQN